MRWLEATSSSRTIDMTLRYSKVDSCGSDFINCSTRRLCNERVITIGVTDLDRARQDDKHTVALGVGLAELFARLEAPRRADLHHFLGLRRRAIFEERKLLKDGEH